MLSEARKNKLTEVCQELIRNKSYSGEEKNVAEAIKTVFEELGL